MSLLSTYIRYSFRKNDRKRDKGLSTPKDVERFDDIPYGKDRRWQILDVYRPRGSAVKLPIIISVHGGGWVYGNKKVYQFYCMSLAQRGFAVINFNYRLAPENKYPAQIEDVFSVIRWAKDNAEKYSFDTGNFFALGDSAGAHLLSVCCAMMLDESYADYYSLDVLKGPAFNAIALNCGIYRQQMPEKRISKGLLDDLLPKGWGKEDLDMLNSYDKIKEGYPPVFLMSSNGDFLKDQPDFLIPQLERCSVPYEFHVYGNDEELLPHVFHVNIRSSAAGVCNDDECAFFRRYMK